MKARAFSLTLLMLLVPLAGCAGNDPPPSQDSTPQTGPVDDAAIASLESQIASLESEIATLEEEIEAITDLAYSQGQRIGELNVQIEDKSNEITQLESSIASLNGEISNLNSIIVDLESTIASRDAQIVALEAEMEDATNNSSLQSTIDELHNAIILRDLLISQKNSTIAQKNSTIQTQNYMMSTMSSEIAELQQDIIDRDALSDQLNSTIATLQQTISENNVTIATLQQSVSNLQGEIAALQAEITQMALDLHPCGQGTTLYLGECVRNDLPWGRLPFPAGTNVSAGQTFNGVFSHYEDGFYAVDFWDADEYDGTPIVAYKAGVVIHVKEDGSINCIDAGISLSNCRHANVVYIDHGDSTYSVYAHLKYNSVNVSVGESVDQGHQIGLLGNTGYSSGPHLHFHVLDVNWNHIPFFFEELANVSAGLAWVGMEYVSNNTNLSTPATAFSFSEYNCPDYTFAYRGVVIASTIPCHTFNLDTQYNLSGHVVEPGRKVVVHQYDYNDPISGGSGSWNYFCIDSNSTTGEFDGSLWWNSSTYGAGFANMMIQMADVDDSCNWEGWPESPRVFVIP